MKRTTAGLCLALAACAGGDPVAQTSPSPEPTTSSSPTPSPSPATSSATPGSAVARTDLGDGRHSGYLKSLDTAKLTLVVDVVQFLTGQAAEKAAKEDGQEAYDYYIRNQNKRVRSLPIAPDAKVVTNTLTSEETGNSAKDTQVTLAKLRTFFDEGTAQEALFHLTLSGGVVVEIHEQYLP